jgi:hypothetical protein
MGRRLSSSPSYALSSCGSSISDGCILASKQSSEHQHPFLLVLAILLPRPQSSSLLSTIFVSHVLPCSFASALVLSTSIILSCSGLGFDTSSCSFAERRSVRASCAGPNILARRAALLRFRVDARAPFAIFKDAPGPTKIWVWGKAF